LVGEITYVRNILFHTNTYLRVILHQLHNTICKQLKKNNIYKKIKAKGNPYFAKVERLKIEIETEKSKELETRIKLENQKEKEIDLEEELKKQTKAETLLIAEKETLGKHCYLKKIISES
jgi:hypothetical protein